MRTLTLPADSPPFTKADWDRLPEGFPAQLIDGWLVKEPSPGYHHQMLSLDVRDLLIRHVERRRVLCAPYDVYVDDRNVYQPDVVVLRSIPQGGKPGLEPPLLVVEILSPSTIRRDRKVKRRRLLDSGTEEVWLVDPDARRIEVYDRHGSREAHGDTALSSRTLPGFTLVPSSLFAGLGPSDPAPRASDVEGG